MVEGCDGKRCHSTVRVGWVKRSEPTILISPRFREETADRSASVKVNNAPRRSPGLMRRVICLLICCVLFIPLTGCDDESPALDVKTITHHAMPLHEATVPKPRCIHVSHTGDLYVLDKAGRVLTFDRNGKLKNQWWMPKYDAGRPEGVFQLKDGRVAVADTHYNRVVIFTPDGQDHTTFGTLGREPGQFVYPIKVVEDNQGFLYVLEYGGNDRVQKFTAEGKFVKAFGGFDTTPGNFQRPSGMVWHDGQLFITDAGNNRVQVFTDDGEFVRVLTNGDQPLALDLPYDLALGPDGLLYIVEYGAGRVTVVKPSGELVARWGSAGGGEEQLATPWGIAVDQQNRVWIADTRNRRLVELVLE